jgi:hypothetical protein
MAKRAARPSGKGDRQYLRDSKSIHGEIRKARQDLTKPLEGAAHTKAMTRFENANGQLRQLNQIRFEKLATERLTTAVRAMDDLIKLTNQPRYAVILNAQHADAIANELELRFRAVKATLISTLEGQAAKQTVGLFIGVSLFQPAQAGAGA